jgi:septum formation protein
MVRAGLLNEMKLDHSCLSPNIDERAIGDRLKDDPNALVTAIALAKAEALLAQHPSLEPSTLLITSDQVVTFHGQIREKPSSKAEAREFMRSYGTCQTVGCIAVTRVGDRLQHVATETTNIVYDRVPDVIIDAVVEEGEVMWCAGGLMIEEPKTRPYLTAIEGGVDAIMGLGKNTLVGLLNSFLEK